MGCSQNEEPVLVLDYSTTPSTSGYQNDALQCNFGSYPNKLVVTIPI